MGLLDRIMGRGSDGSSGFEENFEEEFESIDDIEEEDDDWEEEEEEVVQEWDSAYQFADDALTNMHGFDGVDEFIAKAMIYRINNSERYRDKIAVGRETMGMIEETVNMAEGIRGGGQTNWEEAASQLKGAREVKEEMDKMVDKDEMMLNEFFDIAKDGLEIFKSRSGVGGGGVNTGVRHSDEEL